MFFIFFNPSKLVEIVKEALIKVKELAQKINPEVIYEFLKKYIEYLRNFIGDYFTNILLYFAQLVYDFLRKFVYLDVDSLVDLVNELFNDIKNYIVSHDAEYVANEFKEGWDALKEKTHVYTPEYVGSLLTNYLLALIDAGKKFDVELIVDLFKEILNIFKAFFIETKKRNFLGF